MLPELEADITPDELDREARAELRSLPSDLADLVASHLVAVTRALGADDPERAYEHAKVARRFATRIGMVREVSGIAAYRAGQYAEALGDLRAARRLTGTDAYLPVMADCERGLGRPERALDLIRSQEAERLDRAGTIELAIVESGARRDLGQYDAAVITLQRVPELRDPQPKPWSARLSFAYADALAEAGHDAAAIDWFARAMAFDEDGETDAAERYAELTGTAIEDLEEDFDEEDFAEGDFAEGDFAEGDFDAEDLGADPNETEASDVLAEPAAGPTAADVATTSEGDDAERQQDVSAFGPAFIEPDFGDIKDPDDIKDREADEKKPDLGDVLDDSADRDKSGE
ncbi:tetratricopeptide repeat protein [Sphaerimonospora thailandensis]|uniref:Tetratricopeptide repeat protein n=1 Tax=Sphaerimonospora thailandensis TaxID=795644 RepID=A0A8J3R7V0_9ACTN|nr:hypothetical protein [Sphaerimonospora thailandensis]GIH69985.1 hypothetical protein Mth01_22380 [Sphaerimonospora thailandensis]